MVEDSPQPIELNLHRQSKRLAVSFDNGEKFDIPCELLRVYSPSAEVHGHGRPVFPTGKHNVSINKIEPVGNYAVKLVFDDGHDTGLYSWPLLYRLGKNQDQLQQDYIQATQNAS